MLKQWSCLDISGLGSSSSSVYSSSREDPGKSIPGINMLEREVLFGQGV